MAPVCKLERAIGMPHMAPVRVVAWHEAKSQRGFWYSVLEVESTTIRPEGQARGVVVESESFHGARCPAPSRDLYLGLFGRVSVYLGARRPVVSFHR